MEHSFDVDVAKKYGVPEAIILKNLQFWILKNRANQKNFHDGRYWTYNSVRAFSVLFPYWKPRQIHYALEKLKKQGVIRAGRFNKMAGDKTLWYAFENESEWLPVEETLPIEEEQPEPKSQDDTPYREVSKMYADVCKSLCKRKSKLTAGQKRSIRARFREYKDIEIFREVFEKAESSDFISGRTGDFKANLTWILKPEKFAALLDGFYDNRRSKRKETVEEKMEIMETEF